MKEIKLSQGKVALVDDEDYEELNKDRWYLAKGYNTNYACRYSDRKYMHRLIMNTPKGLVTDHINHNGLDNRKVNLRVCTNTENMRNQSSSKNSTSKYLGVYWVKDRKKWKSQIWANNKKIFLGYHQNEDDAALAYNVAAISYFSEFANLNLV